LKNATVVVGSAYGASQAGPARGSRPTWPFGPRLRGRGACAHGTGRRRPGRIPTVPVTRWSGEGPGSKAVGWWTSFGAAGRKLTGEACPQWRGSAAGKRHRQAGVGVTGWVRAVGEELLDGVVLEVWLTQPKRGWSGLSTAARVARGGAAVRAQRVCRGWSWKGCRGASVRDGARGGVCRVEGGPGCGSRRRHSARRSREGRERRKSTKRGSKSAGRSPYCCTRWWLRRRKRWVVRWRPRCCGRGQGGGRCLKRSAWSGCGRPVVQTGRLTGGPHVVLIFPI
jgi:hypothetical protein